MPETEENVRYIYELILLKSFRRNLILSYSPIEEQCIHMHSLFDFLTFLKINFCSENHKLNLLGSTLRNKDSKKKDLSNRLYIFLDLV